MSSSVALGVEGSYRFNVRDPEGDLWGVSTTWHDKSESLNLPERVI